MYHKKILFLSLKELREKCLSDLPELYEIALQSADPATFLTALQSRASQTSESAENPSPWQRAAAQEILRLIDQEGKTIRELSHDMELKLETLTNLWLFLRGNTPDNIPTDLFIDLYYLFLQLEGRYRPCSSDHSLHMQRWESGLDPTVMTHRERNRERIIDLLVSKIEQRHSTSSPYRFAEGMTTEEKREAVRGWWKNFRFHLSTAIKSPSELNHFLGGTLSSETMDLLHRAKKKGMPFFITPYYLSLLNIEKEGYDDRTIRSYVLYSENLVNTYGSIRAWEREDLVVAGEPNAAGWLLPGHNIHRRYPDVAIMIPDSIGRACGGLCAVCQRMYDFQSERLNFDFKQLIPKESWPEKLVRLMRYFENDSQLRDILVTGGDALMSRNATLRLILDEIYKMALRKRRANLARPDGEKFAELERVRLGSRLLAYLPMRIDQELIGILRNFKQKGAAVGIKQFIIQTHFESPLEMTPEAVQAINALLSAGWTVTNQLVFTVAASRRGHTAKLRRVLNKAGVICYYTFSVKGFAENRTLFAPACRSIQESREEKIAGHLSAQQAEELWQQIANEGYTARWLSTFLKKNGLPFLATDRNVLNLPGIGKSMTFTLAGITSDGRRILCFDHDHTRRHSPIIDKMGKVYIVENKSVAAYLRQLKEMGEHLAEYGSIWGYRSGTTEKTFRLFEYPPYPFRTTEQITHLELKE